MVKNKNVKMIKESMSNKRIQGNVQKIQMIKKLPITIATIQPFDNVVEEDVEE